MLKLFRNFVNTIWGKVFIGGIALIFILLWGVWSDMFMRGIARSDKIIATVAGEKITSKNLWQFTLFNYGEKASEILSNSYNVQFLSSQIINEKLLVLEAKRLGIRVGIEAVKLRIAQMFPTKDGGVDEKKVAAFLQRYRLTNRDLINLISNKLYALQLLQIYPNISIDKLAMEKINTYKNRLVKLVSAPFLAKDFLPKTKKPTEMEIQTIYNENKQSFAIDESREIEVLICKNEALEEISLLRAGDEKLIKNEYEKNKKSYGGKSLDSMWGEIKKKIAADLRANVERDSMNQALDMIANDKSFEDISSETAFEIVKYPRILSNGNFANPEMAQSNFKEPNWWKEMIEKAFSLENGETSDIIQNANGDMIIVRLQKIHPKSYRKIKSVMPRILALWNSKKSFEMAQKSALEFMDKLHVKKSVEQIKTMMLKNNGETLGVIANNLKKTSLNLNDSDIEKIVNMDQGKFTLLKHRNGFYIILKEGVVLNKSTNVAAAKDFINENKLQGYEVQNYYLFSLKQRHKVVQFS